MPHHPLRADDAVPTLRRVRETDAPAVLDAFTASEDMSRQGPVTDLTSAKDYVRWLLAPDRRAAGIIEPGTDRLIGLVALSADMENLTAWFFYWLARGARGRGTMARAAGTVADVALAVPGVGGLGLQRLELGHRANNPASGAVARAAGFLHEGTERSKFLIDGQRHDVHTYGRLATDPQAPADHLPWREHLAPLQGVAALP